MALPQEKLLYSVDEYLEMERAAVERHEYIDGHVYAMAGESLEHSTIITNMIALLVTQLRGKACRTLSPEMKIRSGPYIKEQKTNKGMYSYADLTVVCGEPKFHDKFRDVLLNPRVIIEVLSPSTGSFDQSTKFLRYRANIDTFREYVLVWQTAPMIVVYSRQGNDWLMSDYHGLDAVLYLPSIDCRLPLREIYDRVTFPEPEEEGEEAV
ncbi:MAG: Uma2 family endonuclease [Blastocatellia bacterium]